MLRQWLDDNVEKYNHPSFIASDPVSVPHKYSLLQDIEIAGLFASIMAWGQRPTIIKKANELLGLMDGMPYQFITQHQELDRKRFLNFKHRTLQPDDIIFLTDTLQRYYQNHSSLEDAFAKPLSINDGDIFKGLAHFHDLMFDHPWVMERTRKHISTPVRKSACKRINMYLRWMVRQDDKGVDFGLWKRIAPSQLIIPLDMHVGNVARKLGLLNRNINDWQAAKELTERLKEFDPDDPVKYDFALFGAGINDDFDFV
ncbi:MAG: TIGR02757 family protein [Saprospiraceae bacterium]